MVDVRALSVSIAELLLGRWSYDGGLVGKVDTTSANVIFRGGSETVGNCSTLNGISYR